MTPGRVNYEAHRDHLTHSLYGGMLPPWPMVERALQDAWEAAAQAVIEHYIEVRTVEEDNLTDVKKRTDG